MKYLLDTHAFFWAVGKRQALSEEATRVIGANDSIVFVSIASLWELKIKESLGKITLPKNFYDSLVPAGYEILEIKIPHIKALEKLPLIHRDPFDRMLVAQAQQEQLILVTRDDEIAKYSVKILRA